VRNFCRIVIETMGLLRTAKRWIQRLKRWKKHQSLPCTAVTTSPAQPTFNELRQRLRNAVNAGESDTSEQLLRALRQQFPVPTVDILRKGKWNMEKDQVIFRTHAKAEVEDAVANVESTGRSVSEEDRNRLQLLMSHWFAWSPTTAEHRNDSWMCFLRRVYSLSELQPILDTLVWPEEFARYPPTFSAFRPWMFLLATSASYYLYDLEEETMYKAGDQLADVVDGLQRERWGVDPLLEQVWSTGYEGEARDYFPVYYNVPDRD